MYFVINIVWKVMISFYELIWVVFDSEGSSSVGKWVKKK